GVLRVLSWLRDLGRHAVRSWLRTVFFHSKQSQELAEIRLQLELHPVRQSIEIISCGELGDLNMSAGQSFFLRRDPLLGVVVVPLERRVVLLHLSPSFRDA